MFALFARLVAAPASHKIGRHHIERLTQFA
jgi:hypothetical protein